MSSQTYFYDFIQQISSPDMLSRRSWIYSLLVQGCFLVGKLCLNSFESWDSWYMFQLGVWWPLLILTFYIGFIVTLYKKIRLRSTAHWDMSLLLSSLFVFDSQEKFYVIDRCLGNNAVIIIKVHFKGFLCTSQDKKNLSFMFIKFKLTWWFIHEFMLLKII